MDRAQFISRVTESFEEYKEAMLEKTKGDLFRDAYGIAKICALKDYLCKSDNPQICKLFPYAETVLEDLDNNEWHYDQPMWVSDDCIEVLVTDYLSSKNKC